MSRKKKTNGLSMFMYMFDRFQQVNVSFLRIFIFHKVLLTYDSVTTRFTYVIQMNPHEVTVYTNKVIFIHCFIQILRQLSEIRQ